MKQLFIKFSKMYWCVLPFVTLIYLFKRRKQAKSEYDALCDIIEGDLDTDLANKLDKLHFKYDDKHQELIAVHQRSSIVPNAVDKGTVEVDAAIWMTEQLIEVERTFNRFNLQGKFECYPVYVDNIATEGYAATSDVIVFHLHPLVQNEIQDIEQFAIANTVVTILDALLLVSMFVNCIFMI